MLDEQQQQQQPQPEQALLVDWTLPQSSYYDSNGSNFEEIAATVAAASDAAVDTGDEEVEAVFVHSRTEDRTVDTAPAEDNAACLAADRIHKSVDKEPLPKDGSKVMVA